MNAKRATLEDVGKLAGVSRQTVSRVINDHPLVSVDARARVVAAMEQLDYHPDPVARSLATRRTHLIGVVIPVFSRYNPSRTLEGADDYIREHGYQTFVIRSSADELMQPLRAPMLRKQPVEGVLIIAQDFHDRSLDLFADIRRDLPVVTTGFAADDPRVHAVPGFGYQGGFKAAKHLLSGGRRHFGMITGPQADAEVQNRSEGFLAALEEAQVAPQRWHVVNADWTFERGYEAAQALLAARPEIDAIFAQNDPLAVGVTRAVIESGRRVPDDIAVIGYDDVPLASYVTPTVTSVQNRSYERGAVAARMLLDLREGRPEALVLTEEERIMLEQHLVIRESCP